MAEKKCAVCQKLLLPSRYVSTLIATCTRCQSNRKRQYAARVHKLKIHTESVQTENEELEACQAEQAAEIKRLRAVLTAFRNPDAISDQHMHHMWTHPQDTVAISQLLAVPVVPSARQVNRIAPAGLTSGQPVPEAAEPPSKLSEQITTECKPKSSSHPESSTATLTASGPSLLPPSQSQADVVVRRAASDDRHSLTKPTVIQQEQNVHHAVLPDDWLVSRQPIPPRLLKTPSKPDSSSVAVSTIPGLSISHQPAKRFKPISPLSMSGPVRAAETTATTLIATTLLTGDSHAVTPDAVATEHSTVTCQLLDAVCTWFCTCPSAQQNDGLPTYFSGLWDITTEAKVPLQSPRL